MKHIFLSCAAVCLVAQAHGNPPDGLDYVDRWGGTPKEGTTPPIDYVWASGSSSDESVSATLQIVANEGDSDFIICETLLNWDVAGLEYVTHSTCATPFFCGSGFGFLENGCTWANDALDDGDGYFNAWVDIKYAPDPWPVTSMPLAVVTLEFNRLAYGTELVIIDQETQFDPNCGPGQNSTLTTRIVTTGQEDVTGDLATLCVTCTEADVDCDADVDIDDYLAVLAMVPFDLDLYLQVLAEWGSDCIGDTGSIWFNKLQ